MSKLYSLPFVTFAAVLGIGTRSSSLTALSSPASLPFLPWPLLSAHTALPTSSRAAAAKAEDHKYFRSTVCRILSSRSIPSSHRDYFSTQNGARYHPAL